MKHYSEILVVGSGVSAVNAVYDIVKSGYTVRMLDVGFKDDIYDKLIPDAKFSEIRRTHAEQHRFFLGDEFEGISFDPVGTGPQVTPPRKFVLRNADLETSVVSENFEIAESFALGGLSRAWGAVCYPFLENELLKCSLSLRELQSHYQAIVNRIGISGSRDDLTRFFGKLDSLQEPLQIDDNAKTVMSRYTQNRKVLHRKGLFIGRPLMAALTAPLNDRKAHSYNNMDFWSNNGDSVYRADSTLRELKGYKNFFYEPLYLVRAFTEDQSGVVTVQAKSLRNETCTTFRTSRLILAAGALGTTRIVLRSLNKYDQPVPIVCNRHSYIPTIVYSGLGKEFNDRSHSLAQLIMVYDPFGDREHLVISQLYSYRSLMLFKLINESRLPYREALRIVRLLAPRLLIFTVQHEDEPEAGKYCILRQGKGGGADYLEIVYQPTLENLKNQQKYEKALKKHIMKLGCLPIKIVHPGHGSSIHYGGQFPLSRDDKKLTTELSGRLRGTRSVYITDGSTFRFLPAKGLTFTLMANANRVGNLILKQLSG